VAAALVLISAVLGFVAWKHFREEPPHLVRFDFPAPGKSLFPPNFPTMAVSPDGQRVAFETLEGGKRELWVRDFADPECRVATALCSRVPVRTVGKKIGLTVASIKGQGVNDSTR